MNRLNQYLLCRGGFWNYHRRVPKAYRDLDPRRTIRTALNTDSLQIARARRDALARADEKLWHALQAERPSALDAYEAAYVRRCHPNCIFRSALLPRARLFPTRDSRIGPPNKTAK